MLSSEDIKNIITENYKNLFQDSFQQLINTTIGAPIRVFDLHKKHKFWFVPFLLKSKVRGSAIFDINGKLVSHGVLTPNVRDEEKLIDKEYFESVPESILDEIKDFYKDYRIESQFFSFDLTPQKWGWFIGLKDNNTKESVSVFAGPEGWYEKKGRNDFEG